LKVSALGTTGIEVSRLGLGTVKVGRNRQVKYPHSFDLPDDATVTALLDQARTLGVNLLDTAPAYGTSEQRLGTLLGDNRRHWIICTKVGEEVGEEVSEDPSRFDFTPEHVQHSVERSLRRLGTDYLDIVLIHSDGRDVEILNQLGTLEALRDLKQRGWIRAVGISHKTVAGAERALELQCDVIMATLNVDTTDEAAVIAKAGLQGCGVLIKKALASGHRGPEGLTWVASQPGVTSVVTGTINPQHLLTNARMVAGV
jgi:aryl-alcohol dehydrogenase-like predicted oxidoreductase